MAPGHLIPARCPLLALLANEWLWHFSLYCLAAGSSCHGTSRARPARQSGAWPQRMPDIDGSASICLRDDDFFGTEARRDTCSVNVKIVDVLKVRAQVRAVTICVIHVRRTCAAECRC